MFDSDRVDDTSGIEQGSGSRMSSDIKSLRAFVWSIAEMLIWDFKQSEYGKVILPFVVLRRLDCILETTKPDVLNIAD
jgi:type I restriction enzyme M protein